jgi:lysylphosphatidylglycerol synthase-like protein
VERIADMRRSIPQIISLVALAAGLVLFVVFILGIDRAETLIEVRSLGVMLPVVLLPGIGWHLLRALGWYICFPPESRPSYWRVFRVRLAADGVGYFTIRGVASEPLRVVLLMNRVSPVISAAASVLERTAMGIMSVVGVGVFAGFAVSSDMLPETWQGVFRGIAITAAVVLFLSFLFLSGTGRYFGPMVERIYARTQWRWAGGRTVRAISAVEHLFFKLARTDARRLQLLVLFSILCYWMMALEVFLVFWAIGEPISLWVGTIVETFTRSVSVPGGAIPGNLGALEASNVAVVKALGLAGGGTLALFRRFRSLLFATLGLVLYPRDTVTVAPPPAEHPTERSPAAT